MTEITTDEYFGGCPKCGKTDGYVNVGRDHWGVCDEHKTKWPIGANLFSSWKEETEAQWRRNANLLESYTEVEPLKADPKLFEPERPKSRWQVLADAAYALDDKPHDETEYLRSALASFPDLTDPTTDFEGYAVNALLSALVRNRIARDYLVKAKDRNLDDEMPF